MAMIAPKVLKGLTLFGVSLGHDEQGEADRATDCCLTMTPVDTGWVADVGEGEVAVWAEVAVAEPVHFLAWDRRR
jgi:hypothetical protein